MARTVSVHGAVIGREAELAAAFGPVGVDRTTAAMANARRLGLLG